MIDRACISLNARCNLRCSYCHFANKKNNNDSLKNEYSSNDILVFCNNLSNYIIENALKSFKLGIVGAGEPLLSFEVLSTLVNYFANSDLKNKIKMYVISNGTLLHKDIVQFFYNNREIVELNISLDGDQEINKKLRGCFPDFSIYEKVFGRMPKINAVVTREIIDNQDRIFAFFLENKFLEINFSKVFGTDDPLISISNDEYKNFLEKAKTFGITSRQNNTEKKYDCSKYGKLCGVGRNNIFFTKTGVYPCGRFMNIKKFIIGNWNDSFKELERKLREIKPCPDGECYFEYNKVGK